MKIAVIKFNCISATFVLYLLTDDQNETHVIVRKNCLTMWMLMITSLKTIRRWVLYFMFIMSKLSSNLCSEQSFRIFCRIFRAKKGCMYQSDMKVVLWSIMNVFPVMYSSQKFKDIWWVYTGRDLHCDKISVWCCTTTTHQPTCHIFNYLIKNETTVMSNLSLQTCLP